ncbi:transcriptional regulator, TetR family [Amycolatopsis marina]|uniref:Transcriptional regulator, TetR family n=1 Tax=Amycolatopsis marina TaxID=490629 RepID=A0A1I0YQN3_9PSEU|nr:TetR family transcriptional regulator [Amycolatopsis marina]SFB14770.1 transcriptional regulator, TetR family [Amycolatopsis marina]
MNEGVNRQDGRAERWRQHRVERRREFVEAAIRALDRHGPDAAMADIARAAGVAKPRLYRHFTDKAELFVAVAERASELVWDRLRPALSEPAAVRDRVEQSVRAYFSAVAEHPNVFRMVGERRFLTRTAQPDPVAVGNTAMAALIAAVFDEYLRAHGAHSTGTLPWAHGIVGSVEGATRWWLADGTLGQQEIVEHVSVLVWGAMEAVLRSAGVTVDPDQPLDLDLDELPTR